MPKKPVLLSKESKKTSVTLIFINYIPDYLPLYTLKYTSENTTLLLTY